MSRSQAEKARKFTTLHEGPGAFIIANAFDAGSARVLSGLGFDAIATSSGGFAGTLGRRDGRISRAEALDHARAVVEATDCPVSADFENGFGDAPKVVTETIRLAAEAGLVGCSIEDASKNKDQPIYPFDAAVERIAAAAEAARSLDFDFKLTGRCENFLRGNPDLDDTIRRLKAYEAAGASVLMAPGLPDLEAVRAVCDALKEPFNFMVGIPGKFFTFAELQDAGVRRISLATALYRSAMSGFIDAAKEARDDGTFGFVETAVPTPELAAFMRE